MTGFVLPRFGNMAGGVIGVVWENAVLENSVCPYNASEGMLGMGFGQDSF